jgi:hypothetical protein
MIPSSDIWKKLETKLPSSDLLAARLIHPELSKNLYAGIDANKNRHLLISVSVDDEYNDSKSRGLSVTTRDLIIHGTESRHYIDITCHDNLGYTIFDVIANELAEKIDKDKPQEVIANVISKWRYFWGQPPREMLSQDAVVGLFAELWFLYYWLFPQTDKLDAVNRWRGPFLSRHDFEWHGKSVEVKATTNSQNRIHRIHGIDQLSPPENGELFLFSLRIHEEQGSENTLPKIIALCLENLKDNVDALSKFENALAVAGYSPVHNDEYSKLRFRVGEGKLYKVTNEFPSLTVESFEAGIPNGVGMIEYSINLDGFDHLCIANSPDEIDL